MAEAVFEFTRCKRLLLICGMQSVLALGFLPDCVEIAGVHFALGKAAGVGLNRNCAGMM
jgi:hypothetical protein